jgi:hypothetical protein
MATSGMKTGSITACPIERSKSATTSRRERSRSEPPGISTPGRNNRANHISIQFHIEHDI